MRSDPTENGGLFVGRRPGTAPVRFRELPSAAAPCAIASTARSPASCSRAMIVLSLLCWGPIPLGCLWLGSQVDYLSGSVSFGILVSFAGLFGFLFGALALLRRLDQAWILVRRAAGHDQRTGALGRIFAITAIVCALAFVFWFLVIHGPGGEFSGGTGTAARGDEQRAGALTLLERAIMGLLDYYRQFEGMSEEEVNRACASRPPSAGARRSRAWRRSTSRRRPGPSSPTRTSSTRSRSSPGVACSATRTCAAPTLHDELAERHGVDSGRLILGNGAAELLSSATRALIAPGQRLLTAWPSYPLYPIMARRAHGRPCPSRAASTRCSRRRAGPGRARDRARQPQRPDRRAALRPASSRGCSTACPRASRCCSTSRWSSSPTPSPSTAPWSCSSDHPRLLVFRSFSKAWGLAGLRIGYALGAPGSEELLAELAPDLGVSEVSQAGALEALRSCSELVAERVRQICAERPRADRRRCASAASR